MNHLVEYWPVLVVLLVLYLVRRVVSAQASAQQAQESLRSALAGQLELKARLYELEHGPGGAFATWPTMKVVKRECATCRHFDLEEGQAVLDQHPAFRAAAHHLTPAMMAKRAQYDENGNALQPDAAERLEPIEAGPLAGREDVGVVKPMPAKVKWEEFGACMRHEECRWQHDVCGDYERAADGS